MSDSVTIIMTLDVKPEAVDGICGALPEMIKDTARRPGFQSVHIVRDGNKVQMIEMWDSEADYDNYIAWRTERGEMAGMAALLNGMEKSVWPTLVATA